MKECQDYLSFEGYSNEERDIIYKIASDLWMLKMSEKKKSNQLIEYIESDKSYKDFIECAKIAKKNFTINGRMKKYYGHWPLEEEFTKEEKEIIFKEANEISKKEFIEKKFSTKQILEYVTSGKCGDDFSKIVIEVTDKYRKNKEANKKKNQVVKEYK